MKLTKDKEKLKEELQQKLNVLRAALDKAGQKNTSTKEGRKAIKGLIKELQDSQQELWSYYYRL